MAGSRVKWVMLTLAALTIMGSYYTYDSIAPVTGLLRDQRGFTQLQIGQLNAVFNLPNIALALVGGILIDRGGNGNPDCDRGLHDRSSADCRG